MGKKSKAQKITTNLKILKNKDLKVSIVTPTTEKRKDVLKLLLNECLLKQTYPIYEWIIVSGDKKWGVDLKDAEENFKKHMKNLTKNLEFKVIYYFSNEENAKTNNFELVDNYEAIGYLRNMTNKFVTGDIIVCCDDDDIYVPTRVEHAVSKLSESKYEVAGCSPHILYDTDLNTLFQFKKVHPNHSINSVLAYKKCYLDRADSNYDSTKTFAEEQTFLNKFSVPVLQLDPKHCVIQMVHSVNTFNKRKIVFTSHWMPNEKKNIFTLSSNRKGIESYVNGETLDKYLSVLVPKNPDVYDVVYYLGSGSVKWDPSDKNLGGSEQAVKHLAQSWCKSGYSVAVYGDFGDDCGGEIYDVIDESKRVVYKNFGNFSCNSEHRLLILWRNYGIFPLMLYNVKSKKVVFDVHDNIKVPEVDYDKLTGIIVRSQFHKKCMIEKNKHISKNTKYFIIPNGVRTENFSIVKDTDRDLYRFCWCSCYTRGLQQILMWLFPILKKLEPRVSLHVYYGMDQVKNEEFKKMMNQYLSQPGVFDHGRQNIEKIVEEKQKSTFHLYFAKTNAETDCISIRESACAGCIPILSKYGVFLERNGIHLDGDTNNPQQMYEVAHQIAHLFKKPEVIKKISEDLRNKEMNWDSISQMWYSEIGF